MKYAILIPLLFVSPVEADIKLKAVDTCVVGELVTLDASESKSEKLNWQVLQVDEDLGECPDFRSFGKVACFSARSPSIWLVIIAGDNSTLYTHKIVVGGKPAPPSIESKIRAWYDANGSPNKANEALALAQSFRAISNAEIPPDKFLEATAQANKQALGDALEAWIPFLDNVGAYLDSLALPTTKHYQETWVRIADAIEEATK